MKKIRLAVISMCLISVLAGCGSLPSKEEPQQSIADTGPPCAALAAYFLCTNLRIKKLKTFNFLGFQLFSLSRKQFDAI